MTLILALVCKDGMVFASDGQSVTAATAHGMHLGVQQGVSKINRLGDDKLWGFAGSEGIGQLVKDEIDKLNKSNKAIIKKPLSDPGLREYLKNIHCSVTNAEIERQIACGVSPNYCERASLLFVGSSPSKILHISSKCVSQFCEHYGAMSVGDGIFYAETFLSNFRGRLKDFTVEEGCVIAYRAISDAVQINVGYIHGESILGVIGEPIDVWTIKDKEKAEQKSPNEIERLKDIILSWKGAEIKSFKEFLKENNAFQ